MNHNWQYTYISYHDSFIWATSYIRQSLFEGNRPKENEERGLIQRWIKFLNHKISSDNKQEIQKSDLLKIDSWSKIIIEAYYEVDFSPLKSRFQVLICFKCLWEIQKPLPRVKGWKHVKTSITHLCEESLFRLSHHSSFTVCSVLKSRHKGPRAEGQAILTFVVPRLMDGDERSSIQNHSGVKYRWVTN